MSPCAPCCSKGYFPEGDDGDVYGERMVTTAVMTMGGDGSANVNTIVTIMMMMMPTGIIAVMLMGVIVAWKMDKVTARS